MALILHLSDLHLESSAPEQRPILDALPRALATLRDKEGTPSLVAITGDVFDSATVEIGHAVERFQAFVADVRRALGAESPVVIVPGNHDRRQGGLIGPHRPELFRALAANAPPRTFVHGASSPFLSALVPDELHGLPLSVVAYDSSPLRRGLIGAGGVIRQEDLLRAAKALRRTPEERPALLLLHHHLVPTPLTDVREIDPPADTFLRWGLQLLPELVANADREELTMTALGAGTALSTLHALGRAVLVLHGHKHYATARLLAHTVVGHGDVLIISAGSAGLAEAWSPVGVGDVARLWPSFNVLNLRGAELDVATWSFGYKGSSVGGVTIQPLVQARQDGVRWIARPVKIESRGRVGPRLRLNRSQCRLLRSRSHGDDRWDYLAERRIEAEGPSPRCYLELVEGAPGGRLELLDGHGRDGQSHAVPSRLELDVHDRVTRYRVDGAVCRTIAEAELVQGRRASPYEWIGLMNRYACVSAELSLTGLGAVADEAFASITDLGTGIEEPAELVRSGLDTLALVAPDCPARTLLRIYWPLET